MLKTSSSPAGMLRKQCSPYPRPELRTVEFTPIRHNLFMPTDTYAGIAKMIDHSLLNPTLTTDSLGEGCRLALAYDVASVCIMP